MKEKRSYIAVGGDPIHMIFHSEHWEEVPDEDLWEDEYSRKNRNKSSELSIKRCYFLYRWRQNFKKRKANFI